jgi:hypothetical protein
MPLALVGPFRLANGCPPHPHSPVYPFNDLPHPFLHSRCGGGGSGSSVIVVVLLTGLLPNSGASLYGRAGNVQVSIFRGSCL